ncbi:MAG: hypothetical protein IJZ45_05965 [Bacteroidaceae bacterium]|nr:hypothetical protein [Bacteroidaceae bacterium]
MDHLLPLHRFLLALRLCAGQDAVEALMADIARLYDLPDDELLSALHACKGQ